MIVLLQIVGWKQLWLAKHIAIDHRIFAHTNLEFCKFHRNREIESCVGLYHFEEKNRLRLDLVDVPQVEEIEFCVFL